MQVMSGSVIALALLGAACSVTQPVAPVPKETSCVLSGEGDETLSTWREGGFETDKPDQSALDLATCLGDPDPFLRDKVAYEGLTVLMRSATVSEATRRVLLADLKQDLRTTDPEGFLAPFAALALAEVARTDRITPFLTEAERSSLVQSAAEYLESVRDYRAFSDREGWRHGVAHGADLAMQLTLNDKVTKDSLLRLRGAVTAQIVPATTHAYTHGEPERLARPILFMAMRPDLPGEDWADWFAGLADPSPWADWNEAFETESGLARLHNLKAFAQSLYINASLSPNEALTPIADGALELLKALP